MVESLLRPAFLGADREGLPRDEVFEMLSNERRRGVIHHLKARNGEGVPLDELVRAVAAWETQTSPDALPKGAKASVYSSLVQTHLPRLHEARVVDYDAEAGVVSSTALMRDVELYLEYSPRHDIPWAEYWLGLTAVAAALLAATWVGIPPFDALSGMLLASLIVAVMVVSSVAHVLQTRRARLGSESFERA